MKAIAVTPRVPDSMSIIEVPDPWIGHQDALVKVLQVGICGTDAEIKQGLYGSSPLDSDYLIIGHESLGRVVEVGSNVKGLRVGDNVVASVRRPCPHDSCLPCRSDQNDMCITGDYTERGIYSRHGFMAEYYSEDASFLTKVPAGIEVVAVLLEPLSIVEKAIRQTFKIQERLPWAIDNAIVLGAGAIGLLGAALLRLREINTYVFDRSDEDGFKALLIERLGAHHVDGRQIPLSEVAADVGRIDFILEATGHAPLVFEAYQRLALNGALCLVGISGDKGSVTISSADFNNSLVLGNRSVFGSVNASQTDFQAGVIDMQRIEQRWPGFLEATITRHTTFDQFHLAFERQPSDIKVVIDV